MTMMRTTRAVTITKVLSLGALIFLLVLSILSLAVPWLFAQEDPQAVYLDRALQKPGSVHIFGTDEMGRDVFVRLLYGARVSLTVGVLSMLIALVVGVAYGTVSGFLGGWVDQVMMRLLDGLLSIPTLLFMIAVLSFVTPDVWTVSLVIGLASWFPLARLMRTEIMVLRTEPYVQAARVLGATPVKQAFRHLLPNCLPTILVMSASGIGHAILAEATLSFLGLGIPVVEPSWGNMLIGGQNYIFAGMWWGVVFPGAAIALTVLSITILGDVWQEKYKSKRVKRRPGA